MALYRESEWRREKRAREALMAEVMAEGRQQQLEEKNTEIKREQLENIERRETEGL